MECRVVLKWTDTAKECLRKLPRDARRGLLKKADALMEGGDPRNWCKPLTGPLQGCYRITHSRYRAVFTAEEEEVASGDILLHLNINFIAAGMRKNHDKKDVYRVAEKLVRLVLDPDEKLEGLSDVHDA